MRATSIIANLRVADVDAAKGFYTDDLGLSTEEFNIRWVVRYTLPDTGARVQLVTRDATAPEDSVISVHTDDIEGAYAEAQKLGYEIVHPLTPQAWGVRRPFVQAPDGNVSNIVNHRDWNPRGRSQGPMPAPPPAKPPGGPPVRAALVHDGDGRESVPSLAELAGQPTARRRRERGSSSMGVSGGTGATSSMMPRPQASS